MDNLYVSNHPDLIDILSAIDITVPLRSEGRAKEQCERWSICYWLSTYQNLAYPITLIRRDKPDFYIKSGAQEIGIECTEAIPSDYAQAEAIAEGDGNTVLDMSLFRWGQKRKPREIHEIASRTALTGPGWEGDSPEIEWALAITNVISTKTAKLHNEDFKKFPENYLLIYDNLPRPHIDFSEACSRLMANLNDYWKSKLIFDIVFVQTDDLLISFDTLKSEIFKKQQMS